MNKASWNAWKVRNPPLDASNSQAPVAHNNTHESVRNETQQPPTGIKHPANEPIDKPTVPGTMPADDKKQPPLISNEPTAEPSSFEPKSLRSSVPHLLSLTPPADSSLLDEEVSTIKLSDPFIAKTKDPSFFERARALGKKKYPLPSSEAKPEYLIDVLNTKAAALNQYASELPPQASLLIPISEVPQLDLTKLSPLQLRGLFTLPAQVEALIPSQLNEAITQIPLESLICLKDEQVLQLDYTKINKDQFDAMFPRYGLEPKKRIRAFKNDVIKITPFFGSTLLETQHWGMLDDEQVLHLDYSKINKDQFDAMFPRYGLESKKRIRAFKNDVIKITPFFGSTLLETQHWGMLDDEQVLHLDYSKIKQDQFDAMFPRYGLEPKKRIRSFKNDVSKVTKFFSREHWEMLDDDQKKQCPKPV